MMKNLKIIWGHKFETATQLQNNYCDKTHKVKGPPSYYTQLQLDHQTVNSSTESRQNKGTSDENDSSDVTLA